MKPVAAWRYICMYLYPPIPLLQYSVLKKEFPPNIHLLTMKLLSEEDGQTLLLRLEHQFEISEAPWNQNANVSLAVSL